MNPSEGPSSQPSEACYFVDILRCSDGSYYVGHAQDVEERLGLHNDGRAAAWTAARRPVQLLYVEPTRDRQDAIRRERELKGWSRAKKDALIAGDRFRLKTLSRCRS